MESEAASELRSLARYPKEQTLRALALLADGASSEAANEALNVLAARTGTEPRSPHSVLVALYGRLDKEGTKRDAGGYLRIAVLKALRPMVRATDTALLEKAASTYEFGQRGEIAADLRAEALLTLSHADAELAAFHAVRLLHDEHTSEMSGQPALMAARVLAAQELVLPLYAYALEPGGRPAEVISECLHALKRLPATHVRLLFERYRQPGSEIATLGLVDLLLSHGARRELAPLLFRLLTETRMYDVYHYAVTALVATHDAELLAGLLTVADKELDRRKLDSLASALALVRGDERVDECLGEVKRKLGASAS